MMPLTGGISMGVISEVKAFLQQPAPVDRGFSFYFRDQVAQHLAIVPKDLVYLLYQGAQIPSHPVMITVPALVVTKFFIDTASYLSTAFEAGTCFH